MFSQGIMLMKRYFGESVWQLSRVNQIVEAEKMKVEKWTNYLQHEW